MEYTEQFFNIFIRADVYENKEALAAKYIVGVWEDLLDGLVGFSLYTVDEIYQKALQFEHKLKRTSSMHMPTPEFSSSKRPPLLQSK